MPGLFSVVVPEEYGGMGLGVFELALMTEELSRVCGGISLSRGGVGAGHVPDSDFRQRRAEEELSAASSRRASGWRPSV